MGRKKTVRTLGHMHITKFKETWEQHVKYQEKCVPYTALINEVLNSYLSTGRD